MVAHSKEVLEYLKSYKVELICLSGKQVTLIIVCCPLQVCLYHVSAPMPERLKVLFGGAGHKLLQSRGRGLVGYVVGVSSCGKAAIYASDKTSAPGIKLGISWRRVIYGGGVGWGGVGWGGMVRGEEERGIANTEARSTLGL